MNNWEIEITEEGSLSKVKVQLRSLDGATYTVDIIDGVDLDGIIPRDGDEYLETIEGMAIYVSEDPDGASEHTIEEESELWSINESGMSNGEVFIVNTSSGMIEGRKKTKGEVTNDVVSDSL
jgi:hypothetical protein